MATVSIVGNFNPVPPNAELMLALTGLLISLWINDFTNWPILGMLASVGFLAWTILALAFPGTDSDTEEP